MNRELDILCVEDNELDFMLMERELRKMNRPFRIDWVMSREAFIDALDKKIPDIILCDHNLPEFSSNAAFEIIQAKELVVPFILVTATINEEEAVRQVNLGIDDYILKDRLQRLPSAVLRAVKLSAALKDKERFFRELVAKERRFRGLVEQSHESVILCNSELKVQYVSPAFTNIFLQKTTYEDQPLADLLPVQNDPFFAGVCERALQNPGEPFRHELVIATPRRDIWLECTFTNLLEAKHVQAFVVNLRNVTERRNFQNSLERTQAILSSIINNSEIAYVLVDPEFKVVTFNTQAKNRYLQEFRKTLREGDLIFDYLPEERKPPMKKLYQTALDGRTFRYEADFPHENGETNWYEVNVFPIHEKTGKLLGIVIATGDITERKRSDLEKDKMTAELLVQNKNLAQFSYIISHNLRSPVANILGLSELLRHPEQLSDEEFNRCAGGMRSAALKIDQVILDLHEILKTRETAHEGRQILNFAGILKETTAILSELIRETGTTITSEFGTTEFFGIKSYVHSIFLNLISNSIRYRNPHKTPQITISSAVDNGFLSLRFSDNGSGIDLRSHGDQIFGLYKKFHSNSEGRGMGLFMVKTQCELMGGTISVKSVSGEGSVFEMRFPV